MSVPSAAKARAMTKEVITVKKNRFKDEIDKSVQLLKNRAAYQVENIERDGFGYWEIRVTGSEIKYHKPERVINEFVLYMKKKGYALPDVEVESCWWSKAKSVYIIRFRIDKEDDGEENEEEEDDSDSASDT
jgi:hypothetical protein